jgi:hypothetical protein
MVVGEYSFVPRGFSRTQQTNDSLSCARESHYPKVRYESLSVKLTNPDSKTEGPEICGRGKVECGLPEIRK